MDGATPDSDLLSQLASALGDPRASTTALQSLDPHERALLLRIARNVAHATERQNAPLASYLIGRFVQSSMAAGMSEPDALARAAAIVTSLVGESPD
ncbi:MAG TPA: DUF6457 domain-containing protein [Candidatus Saccharimonadales bacterium]|nr:DUF6457 domain-containing protein [Candidatus Saccharimonadales bacterium]